ETPDKQNAFFIGASRIKMTDEDPDYPAMIIANYVFGGGVGTSRLWGRLREKEGFSYGAGSQMMIPTKTDNGMLLGYAIYAPQNGPKLENAFQKELSKVLQNGFTAEEVENAKKSWLQ